MASELGRKASRVWADAGKADDKLTAMPHTSTAIVTIRLNIEHSIHGGKEPALIGREKTRTIQPNPDPAALELRGVGSVVSDQQGVFEAQYVGWGDLQREERRLAFLARKNQRIGSERWKRRECNLDCQ